MGKTIEQTAKVSPEQLFNEVLLELYDRDRVRFHVNLKKWHKAFYDAKSRYPQPMEDFEELFMEWPYIHAITECFHEFVQAHHLSRIIPDDDFIINNPENMRNNWNPNSKILEIARYICDRI